MRSLGRESGSFRQHGLEPLATAYCGSTSTLTLAARPTLVPATAATAAPTDAIARVPVRRLDHELHPRLAPQREQRRGTEHRRARRVDPLVQSERKRSRVAGSGAEQTIRIKVANGG